MGYDKRAAGFVQRLERTVLPRDKLSFEHVEFGALLNALTVHIEEGGGHPEVVEAYEGLFIILAEIRGVSGDRVTKAREIFRGLQQYLRQSS